MHISFELNGERLELDAEPQTLLVELLRDHLSLTGTHIGCETSQCGACTVLIDGLAVKACTVFTPQIHGKQLLTIEGLARDGKLHPMQEAFRAHHGLQCGFCTPGMIMAALGLVGSRGYDLDEAAIADGLEGNLCRCTGYRNIFKAVQAGARAMAQGA